MIICLKVILYIVIYLFVMEIMERFGMKTSFILYSMNFL